MRTIAILAVLSIAPLAEAITQEQAERSDSKLGRFLASISAGLGSDLFWDCGDWDNCERSQLTVGVGAYVSLSEAVRIGLEGGHLRGVTADDTMQWTNPPWTPQVLVRTTHFEESLYWATLSSSFGPRVGPLRPHLAVDLGAYFHREVYVSQERDLNGAPDPEHPDQASHETDTYFGADFGLGIEARRLFGPLGFGVEGGWHVFLEPGCDTFGSSCLPSFRTLVLTVIVG